jgi:hypothetical protein
MRVVQAMQSRRRIRFIFSVLFVPCFAAAQTGTAGPASIIGTWEALSRSPGGLGSTIAFGPDNTMTFTIGAMVDMSYRLSGDSLFVTNAEGDLPPAQISIAKDTLVVTRDGREQRETRVSEPQRDSVGGDTDSLVGLWTYRHYTGVPAYEEYTSDGGYHLRVPIRTLKGNYTTDGNSAMLHLIGDGGGDRAVKFAVAGDTLQLTWNGQTTRYLRAAR